MFHPIARLVALGLLVVAGLLAGLNLLAAVQPAVQDPPKTLTVDLGSGVSMEFVLIQKGKFLMGSPPMEKDRNENETQHEVEITKPFYLAKYPVTQGQYEAITGKNPSWFCASGEGKDKVAGLDTKKFPVENVSWDDAKAFCAAMKKKDKDGRDFRLPTEAEWEYVCRAGTQTAYYYGDEHYYVDDPGKLGDYAWYSTNSGARTHPVGEKKPNAWGLCDMHGNVWQWCEDWYGEYPMGKVVDPRGPATGSDRVLRGGSWINAPRNCRSALRSRDAPADRGGAGFRLVVPVR